MDEIPISPLSLRILQTRKKYHMQTSILCGQTLIFSLLINLTKSYTRTRARTHTSNSSIDDLALNLQYELINTQYSSKTKIGKKNSTDDDGCL